MRFPEAWLSELRARTPLVPLIGQTVKLDRAGRDWKGCCPFHAEKTPSFTVYADHFHCFGCQVRGDAIEYLRLTTGVPFHQAVEQLAGEAGMDMPAGYTNGNGAAPHGKRPPAPPSPRKILRDWAPIVPPPADAPPPAERDLRCDALHTYRDAAGTALFHIRRHEARGDKRKLFVPLTYGSLSGRLGWHPKAPDAPRPLFGLDRLAARPEATVIVCEGEKAADAAAWLFPDHVCMTWPGGVGAVESADWTPLARRTVIVWPDNDPPGHEAAAKLATILPTARVLHVADLDDGADAADLQPDDPAAWLQDRLPAEDTRPVQPGRTMGRLRIYSVLDLLRLQPRDYVLKGILSPAEMSVFVGLPKCGKSFLALHVAYAIAQGRSVFGRRVHPTSVLYVAAEGERGMAKRIDALQREYGPCDAFHAIAQPADLLHCDPDSGDLRDLIAAAQFLNVGLVVLDTLSRLIAGGDENGPADMGKFISNVSELRYATGAHIAVVHHGNQASDGKKPRGHTSLTGAADMIMEIAKAEDGSRTATVAAAKDDADGSTMGFRLRLVELGQDADGDPITTLVVDEIDQPAAAGLGLSPSQETARRFLADLIVAEGEPLPPVGFPTGLLGVSERRWRGECESRRLSTAADPKDRERVFRRVYRGLMDGAVVAARDGWVWLSADPVRAA